MKNNLEQALRAAGVTQTELAKRTGLSRGFINRLVNNKPGVNPTLSDMNLISKALNISAEDIFFKHDVILVLQKGKVITEESLD